MTNELDVFKALPTKVVEETYSDGVRDTLQEVSKIGVDAVKTFRLVLFPLQFLSAFQDRLAGNIDRSIRKVPPERRVSPVESLTLQIGDKLRFQEEGSIVTEMYVGLLARAIDRERVGEAHPAFIHIVSQLAQDEAVILQQLSASEVSAYMRLPNADRAILREERAEAIGNAPPQGGSRSALQAMMLRPEDLSQPELIYTYVDHLDSLGIITSPSGSDARYHPSRYALDPYKCAFIQLNRFGKLFHSACLSDLPGSGSRPASPSHGGEA